MFIILITILIKLNILKVNDVTLTENKKIGS